MKFIPKNSVKKFQVGGPLTLNQEMPEEMPAELMPAGEEQQMSLEQNPLIMLAEGAIQALQSNDCLIAMQVCQGLILIVQLISASGPEAPTGEPVFRKGGILLRRIKK